MVRICAGLMWIVAVVCPMAKALEEMPPENMGRILRSAENDDALDTWSIDQIEKFAKDFMWRPKCNVLDRTQFAIAQLEAMAARGNKAIEVLEKLGAAASDAEVKSAVQFDVAIVYQRRMKDPDRAAEAFKKVTGRYAVMARRDLVRMWQEAGQTGKAIEYLRATIAQTKDKGEKLGLLLRLSKLCQDQNRTEDVLAADRQIAEEFTAKDIEDLKAAAVKKVDAVYENAWELHKQGRAREWPEEVRKLRIWALQLDQAGRADEAKAAARGNEHCTPEIRRPTQWQVQGTRGREEKRRQGAGQEGRGAQVTGKVASAPRRSAPGCVSPQCGYRGCFQCPLSPAGRRVKGEGQ